MEGSEMAMRWRWVTQMRVPAAAATNTLQLIREATQPHTHLAGHAAQHGRVHGPRLVGGANDQHPRLRRRVRRHACSQRDGQADDEEDADKREEMKMERTESLQLGLGTAQARTNADGGRVCEHNS